MKTVLRNLFFFLILIIVVLFASHYAHYVRAVALTLLQTKTTDESVQGVSTNKTEELSEKMKSDLYHQALFIKEYSLQISVADVLGIVSRVDQVPDDFDSVKSYSQDFFDRMIQSRGQK